MNLSIKCLRGIITFFLCHQVKKVFAHEDRPLKVHERLMSGSTAGVIAQTTIYPMEVGEGEEATDPVICRVLR